MMDAATATGAPVERDVNGETVLFFPLRFLEWGRLEQWMRDQVISAAKNSIRGDTELTRDDKMAIMMSAHKSAMQLSLMSCFKSAAAKKTQDEALDAAAYLESFEGMLRVCWLSARGTGVDEGPRFALAEFDKKLNQNLSLLTELYVDVLELSLPAEKEIQADEKKQAAPAKNPETAKVTT